MRKRDLKVVFLIFSITSIIVLVLFKISQNNDDAIKTIYDNLKGLQDSFNYAKSVQVTAQTQAIEPSISSINDFNRTTSAYVVISSNFDINTDFYSFYLPITATSWRRLGVEPVVILVKSNSTDENNELYKKVLEYLKILNIITVNIDSPPNNELIIGMTARLFVGLLPDEIVKDDQFIMTSDTDLLPIKESYYNIAESKDKIVLWNAFCCGSFSHKNVQYEMYPIGHIGMRKKYWKQIMQLDKDKQKFESAVIFNHVLDIFGYKPEEMQNNKIGRGDQYWYMDQKTISMNIKNNKKDVELDKRGYTGSRLDRAFSDGSWLSSLSRFDSLTDCHSLHGDIFSRWSVFQKFMEKLFPTKYNELFNKYFNEYMEIRKRVKV